jgi:hypothetical protein
VGRVVYKIKPARITRCGAVGLKRPQVRAACVGARLTYQMMCMNVLMRWAAKLDVATLLIRAARCRPSKGRSAAAVVRRLR